MRAVGESETRQGDIKPADVVFASYRLWNEMTWSYDDIVEMIRDGRVPVPEHAPPFLYLRSVRRP